MRKTLILVCLCLFIVSCGGGGGGSSSPFTAPTSSSTTTTTSSSAPSSDKLLGNFHFVFTTDKGYYDDVTMDTQTTQLTSEGTVWYRGHNTKYTDIIAFGAWFPSNKAYAIGERLYYSKDTYMDTFYTFVIEGDKRLTGCMYFADNGGALSPCYSLNSSLSRKTARMSALSGQSNTIWQDMTLNARESNSGASVLQEDADLKAKIAELQAVLRSAGN